MSLHIDPKALHTFAGAAAGHSTDLQKINVNINLHSTSLGKFEEATELVEAINAHTAEVNQCLHATSQALLKLAEAATLAATLSHSSDEDINRRMKTINHQIDDARRTLGPHVT